MKKHQASRWALPALLPALAMLALAGCDASPSAPAAEAMAPEAALENRGAPVRAHGDLLRAVRQETARFNSLNQAERAGYEMVSPCVAHPDLGAMGHHFLNGALIDPFFDPLQPEVLLYVPNDDGTLKLVGVEYIVIDVGQPHPHFGDHPFDVGGVPELEDPDEPVPHWSLHVWAHSDNPAGTFSPFNSALSCPPMGGEMEGHAHP